ncbi:chlorite dismutase family protein [Candidatus Poribacteria bacterium]|nr:chlorite dismutase family protein [Candidatus Poribacteria bacterium]MYG08425.1 chlorite dismutase family protein [Candidatus Poribacteria bacterium]MYK21697.1 chlorite dismutase family protein [Candidatus Poribacteria bacterium]
MNIEQKKPQRPELPDIQEVGAPIDGELQVSDRRLFFQLHVFEDCSDASALIERLEESRLNAVLYDDFNNPTGIGVLFITEDPVVLTTEARDLLAEFQRVANPLYRAEMTMIGRTYASGREPNLEEWLLNKPLQNALNPEFPWGIWYPLRRNPEFYRLEHRERGRILGEHAILGRRYAAGGYASDIRLACFGLDTNDNEFVIGLVGAELYPLSRLIQDMRQTEQTTKYIESLGPFFIGKVRKQFTKRSM